MELAYFLILFALAVSSIQADRINMLEIKTSDCDDCGMGHFGELRAEVCNSMNECCFTSSLDNHFTDDFNQGAVDNFAEHDDLNQCDQFNMNNSPPTQIRVTLLHEGSDGWKGDWISVHTDRGQYQCQLTKFLDGDDSEDGQQCTSF